MVTLKKVAHTRLPSVGFRSWSRFFAVSLPVMWVINPAAGCHYFPPGLQLLPQPLRGLLPILLLGEQRHNGCEQFAYIRLLPDSVTTAIWTLALLRLSPARYIATRLPSHLVTLFYFNIFTARLTCTAQCLSVFSCLYAVQWNWLNLSPVQAITVSEAV